MDDFVGKELIRVLERLEEKMEKIIEYIDKAEQEVPEYLRRHTMYLHDLIHMRWGAEQVGLQIDPLHAQEIERAYARLNYCIEEERHQGGRFHKHMEHLIKEGLLDKDGRKRDFLK